MNNPDASPVVGAAPSIPLYSWLESTDVASLSENASSSASARRRTLRSEGTAAAAATATRATRSSTASFASMPSSTSSDNFPRRRPTRTAAVAARAAFAPATTTRRRVAPDTSPSPRKNKRRKTAHSSNKKPPPNAKQDPDEKLPPCKCCICLDESEPKEASRIDGCDHLFCFGCIGKWAERENSCPLCKARFTKIERLHQQRKRKGVSNTKNVKPRDQRSDILPGSAFEGILQQLLANRQDQHGLSTRLVMSRMMPFGRRGGISFGPTTAAGYSHDDDDEDGDIPDLMSFFLRAPIPPRTLLQTQGVRRSSRGARMSATQPRTGTSAFPPSTVAGLPSAPPFSSASFQLHPLPNPFLPYSGSPTASRPRFFARQSVPQPPARSFASNVNDRSAGQSPHHPLEIVDDDTTDDCDDDSEVEVVQVTRPPGL